MRSARAASTEALITTCSTCRGVEDGKSSCSAADRAAAVLQTCDIVGGARAARGAIGIEAADGLPRRRGDEHRLRRCC